MVEKNLNQKATRQRKRLGRGCNHTPQRSGAQLQRPEKSSRLLNSQITWRRPVLGGRSESPGTQESRKGISEIEGKTAREAAKKQGYRLRFNREKREISCVRALKAWPLLRMRCSVIRPSEFLTDGCNYEEKVLPMKDGLPKLKDFPKEIGGSGETLPE